MKLKKQWLLPLALTIAIAPAAFAEGGAGQKHAADAIKKMDQNRDGQLSQQEFSQSAMRDFRQVDRDGNNQLDQQEQQQLAEQWEQGTSDYSRGRYGQSGVKGQSSTTGLTGSSSQTGTTSSQ